MFVGMGAAQKALGEEFCVAYRLPLFPIFVIPALWALGVRAVQKRPSGEFHDGFQYGAASLASLRKVNDFNHGIICTLC